MAHATTPDGVRLVYELEGSGPPLLLHTGAACDGDLWRAAGYVESLARSYTCIVFDPRSHGRSDHPLGAQANHIERYVDDVVFLLDELGFRSCSFWGYSNGMIVGLKVAEENAERVRRLVGSGAFGDTTDEELAAFIPGRISEHRRYGWDKLIASFEEEEGEVPAWMKERIRASAIEPYLGWLEARRSWSWNPWEALPRVQVPTLFVVGEFEDPNDDMALAASRMPDGRRVRIPGKGHINAFLASESALVSVEPFLAAHAEEPAKRS